MKSNHFRHLPRLLVLLLSGPGLILIIVCSLVSSIGSVKAQTLTPPVAESATVVDQQEPTVETLEARVLSATPPGPCSGAPTGETPSSADVQPEQGAQLCQRVELLFTDGSLKGQRVIIEDGQIPVAERSAIIYKAGDQVLVDRNRIPGQPDTFYITDFIRTNQLLILALIFVGLVIAFGGFKGFSSLIGLAISFLILLYFVLPRIVAGDDPVLISIMGSFFIMLATLYLSHGFSLKTTAALLGTAISLIITGVLA